MALPKMHHSIALDSQHQLLFLHMYECGCKPIWLFRGPDSYLLAREATEQKAYHDG